MEGRTEGQKVKIGPFGLKQLCHVPLGLNGKVPNPMTQASLRPGAGDGRQDRGSKSQKVEIGSFGLKQLLPVPLGLKGKSPKPYDLSNPEARSRRWRAGRKVKKLKLDPLA